MAQQIQLRRDTAANWTSINPTLAIGEVGIETDTLKLKIGSGLLNWNSLSYYNGVAVQSVSGTSPISSSGGTTPSISIGNAAADGTTKGAAAFNASDFDATAGVVSIDYTNAQSASGSTKGFLTSGDWTTFNSKQATITTGSVDNAILRADGTGGTTLQNSGLIIDDAIVSFSVTGVASTDIITATGSAFVNGQPVRFTALTGGVGISTSTNYFVINVSGSTFQISTSIGGSFVNFSTDITAGTLVNGHFTQPFVAVSENTTETNSSLVLSPKGTGAFIIGPKPDGGILGGSARGTNSVDLQRTRGGQTQVASGNGSIVLGGANNSASSDYAMSAGFNNNASNQYTFCHGNQSTASGNSSFCFGTLNTSSGIDSSVVSGSTNTSSATLCAILGGQQAIADRRGMQAHAIGRFAVNGDAQRARFVLRCKTTTNTGVEMALDGATTYLGIPSGKVIAMTINISGVKSDGLAVAHYLRQYCVKNVSGTSTQVYAPVTIGTDNAAGTSIALSANDADDTLRILVTGVASETWRWVASIDAVEIAYGT